jgi:hypothetical protein
MRFGQPKVHPSLVGPLRVIGTLVGKQFDRKTATLS